jgi:hypothetical protein
MCTLVLVTDVQMVLTKGFDGIRRNLLYKKPSYAAAIGKSYLRAVAARHIFEVYLHQCICVDGITDLLACGNC